ncbi:MAG TPA: hypothetical protein VIL88_17930 [Devosia sp.]|uniref:hypothetical protein n=1 Tax=Devosia sp. TaxID=1871048 RepID=UPI002F9493BA
MAENTRSSRVPDTGARDLERLTGSSSVSVTPNDEDAAREAIDAIFGKVEAHSLRDELARTGNEIDAGKGHKR